MNKIFLCVHSYEIQDWLFTSEQFYYKYDLIRIRVIANAIILLILFLLLCNFNNRQYHISFPNGVNLNVYENYLFSTVFSIENAESRIHSSKLFLPRDLVLICILRWCLQIQKYILLFKYLYGLHGPIVKRWLFVIITISYSTLVHYCEGKIKLFGEFRNMTNCH